MKPTAADVRFFATPAKFRDWLQKNHASASELWVGFYRKDSGKPSITWPESVDEALCFGWIDGIRKTIDKSSYKIRFTPRKPKSNWSKVNIARVAELQRLGRMQPPGLAAFARRDETKSGYSYEQRKHAALDPAMEKEFRQHTSAWKFFAAQPPGYRKLAAWYVISAKQDATRAKRLDRLIKDSEAGRRLL